MDKELAFNTNRCPAVSVQFGPGNTKCGRLPHHNGPHRDTEGREWFNLSEVIRNDKGSSHE